MYELRPLSGKDLYPMLKLIGKLGLEDFKKVVSEDSVSKLIENNSEGEKVDVASIGAEIIISFADIVIKNLANCEDEVNSILSSLTGKSKKEISELPFVEYTELIFAFVQKEEFPAFIKAAKGLFKK